MGQSQRDAIASAIDEVMTAGDEGVGLCCTMETSNAEGQPVTIQVMQDSINISPYAHEDEPLDRLDTCGATDGLDANLELVDWEAGVYATVGVDGLNVEEVAELVDQIFVRLLGCSDAGYQISASTEDLG